MASCPFDKLDDALLLHIVRSLDPKPDVFQLARTCQRFHLLGRDRRNWLQVCPASAAPPGAAPTCPVTSGHAAPARFYSFQQAVQASRPGDTILLLRGCHQLPGVVVVDKCLSIVALGHADDTLLCCNTKAEPVLDIRATCKITNLSIASHCAPCVLHRAGQLQLDRCRLTCNSHGLDHLCAPIITSATTAAAAAVPCTALGYAHSGHAPTATLGAPCSTSGKAGHGVSQAYKALSSKTAADVGTHGMWQASSRAEGLGRLTVTECLLEGGSRAVACMGSGQLQAVRVIYQAHRALFYLDVDCRVPGTPPSTQQQAATASMSLRPWLVKASAACGAGQRAGQRQQQRNGGVRWAGADAKPGQHADNMLKTQGGDRTSDMGTSRDGHQLEQGANGLEVPAASADGVAGGAGVLTGLAALAQLGSMFSRTTEAQAVFEMHFKLGHSVRAPLKRQLWGTARPQDGGASSGDGCMLCDEEQQPAGVHDADHAGSAPTNDMCTEVCAACGLGARCACSLLLGTDDGPAAKRSRH